MTFKADEPRDFHRFLDKFKILEQITWTPKLIALSIQQVCQDIIDEGIDYCWMDLSINKYMSHLKEWHKRDVIRFIKQAFDAFAPDRVGLILSIKYESSRTGQRQYAALIDEPGVADDLVGIDLVGDESYFDPHFYAPLFKNWKSAGKITRAHVAESCPAENCLTAMRIMGVDEIAHGIKIVNHPDIMMEALERNVGFQLAITSNELTGLWTSGIHPIVDMINFGLDVSIGTDDPIQCNTTYDREFNRLFRILQDYSLCRAVARSAERRTNKYGLLKSTTAARI